MSTDKLAAERAAFEAWFFAPENHLSIGEEDAAWQAWQARAALEAEAKPAPAEPVAVGWLKADMIRAAVAAMPHTNPGVADYLLSGDTMHTEADDVVAIFCAGMRAAAPAAPAPITRDEARALLIERAQKAKWPGDPAPAAPDPHPDTHAFKNFHSNLCKRFGYMHDEQDWRRDLVSLEEWIAKRAAAAPAAPAPLTDAQLDALMPAGRHPCRDGDDVCATYYKSEIRQAMRAAIAASIGKGGPA